MAKSNDSLILFLNSGARHLTGERRQAYNRGWRREVILSMVAGIVSLLLIIRDQVGLALLFLVAVGATEAVYTLAKGETYLQLRSQQWDVDKQERERLHKNMEEVGNGKN